MHVQPMETYIDAIDNLKSEIINLTRDAYYANGNVRKNATLEINVLKDDLADLRKQHLQIIQESYSLNLGKTLVRVSDETYYWIHDLIVHDNGKIELNLTQTNDLSEKLSLSSDDEDWLKDFEPSSFISTDKERLWKLPLHLIS